VSFIFFDIKQLNNPEEANRVEPSKRPSSSNPIKESIQPAKFRRSFKPSMPVVRTDSNKPRFKLARNPSSSRVFFTFDFEVAVIPAKKFKC
jgi:hypothetical protein